MKKFRLQAFSQDGRFLKGCSLLSFASLLAFFLDIILFGAAGLGRIGFLTTRILFFALSVFFSLPLLLRQGKKLLSSRYVLLIVSFVVWVGICAVRGFLAGNRRDIIKTDVFGYLNFLVLPTMLCVVNTKKRQRIMMWTVIAASAVMVLSAVVISFYPYFETNTLSVYAFLQSTKIWAVTLMDGNATRVVMHTASRVFPVAFLLCAYLLCRSSSKKAFVGYTALMALLIVGVFLSYSRAFYAGAVLAVVAAIVIALLMKDPGTARLIKAAAAAVAAAVILIGGLSIAQETNLFRVAVYRVAFATATPGSSDDNFDPPDGFDDEMFQTEMESLSNRQLKLTLLWDSIEDNVVFGNGLGAAIDLDDGYVEYSYQDIWNKMGLIGLLLFLAPFVYMTVRLFTWKKRAGHFPDFLQIAAWSVCLYFLFIAYFNPCMNTTVGIAHYLLAAVLFFQPEGSGKLPEAKI